MHNTLRTISLVGANIYRVAAKEVRETADASAAPPTDKVGDNKGNAAEATGSIFTSIVNQ